MPETALMPATTTGHAGRCRPGERCLCFVPRNQYSAVMSQYAQAADLLDAIEMFSPLNLAALVRRFEDIINAIDTRLGQMEYRLDIAGVKPLENGVPDEETGRYFTLPLLREG